MAEVFHTVGRVFRISSTVAGEGTNTYIIGDASDGIVGTFAVHFVPGAGFAGGITVKARSRQPEATTPLVPPMPATIPFQPIPYLKLSAGGAAVSPPAYDSAAIAAAAIILIPATGLQIALDVTVTGGDGWVFWTPCEGAAA